MKKWIISGIILCVIGVADIALAGPVFSSSLGGGGIGYGYTTVRDGRTYTPSTRSNMRKRVVPRRTVFCYSVDQTAPNEKQREILMKIVRRIQDGKASSVEVVSIARDDNLNYYRLLTLNKFFQGYLNVQPRNRRITGSSVLDSNNNTVEIIEYR